MPRTGLNFIGNDKRRAMIDETLRLLLEELGESLLSVVVFGSVARGEETPASDIDLLVVSRSFSESLSDRMDQLARILIRLEKTRTFKKMRNFMEKVLSGLEKRLKRLGAKRVFLKDGSWYWDLKPDVKKGEVIEI